MLVSTVVAYSLGCVQLFVTPRTVAHQSLSVRFPRQEYWSGLPFPPLGNLSDPGTEPEPPALQADSLPLSHLGSQNTLWYLCAVEHHTTLK